MVRAGRVLVALSFCLTAGYASAQEAPATDLSSEQIRALERQIEELQEMAEADGAEVYDSMGGLLSSGETGTMDISLEGGREYAIVGICDDACSDIDFTVYDLAGDILDADIEADNMPVVVIFPETDGELTIEVDMADCAEDPCAVAILVFSLGE